MLPHALIVATTLIGLPAVDAPAAADVVGLDVEHAASSSVAHTAAAASPARRGARGRGVTAGPERLIEMSFVGGSDCR